MATGADGTARVTVWENRKSPEVLSEPARVIHSRGLFVWASNSGDCHEAKED